MGKSTEAPISNGDGGTDGVEERRDGVPMTAAVNLAEGLFITEDGDIVPIVMLVDANGDRTDNTAEAVAFAAGEGSRWFSGALTDFEEARVQ